MSGARRIGAARKLALGPVSAPQQLGLPGMGWGGLRADPILMRRLVAAAVAIDTANDARPREKIAHVTRGTLQGASNILRARTGLNWMTVFQLMCGFPVLQQAVIEVVRRYAADPEILDRKVAELEATWRSLRAGGE